VRGPVQESDISIQRCGGTIERKQETHTCYNCDEKGHLSHHCPNPQKQWIHSAEPNKVDIKGLVPEAVTAAMDAQDSAKKVE